MAADQPSLWSVDSLAASNLAADLKLDLTPEQVEQVARHFAEHRVSMSGWAAERLRARMVEVLETTSQALFMTHNEAWALGFNQAEQIVLTARLEQILHLEPAQPRSRGQILRSMIRQARPR